MGKSRWEYIYGINPAFEVLRGERRKIHEAFLNAHSPNNSRLKKLSQYLTSKHIEIAWVDKGRLMDLAESKEHQGAVLRVSPYPYVSAESLFGKPHLLLLDNVEDPHNTGAILRCADVFGFHAVLTPEKGVPEIYPSVVKVSAGATEHIDIAREGTANKLVMRAKEEGYTVVALDAKGPVEISKAPSQCGEKILLVIGGEAKSVSHWILENADVVASIQQHGRVNSLNASVAAGIAMFSFCTGR
ncbi:MAG: 23S rRNA (guanosine(2251)-2'-O)-methyltransferase RlmB [Verrucomicrobia bacterium]|nr:23S rRNA (guanosine(2251)-2'-O)-methyltransferase RlmB [Kiritimatiellia bacterium]MCB1101128.1 23S rRNA (guanosine(2251)-2'-O)-methyltransferase RlmB [Kiritimatiellia bacterium]MCP5489275.1 23S rRNA (guanosine(2251)-2'-O)-methyltransferase RlmB [Verrucomicrobiota bacterium]